MEQFKSKYTGEQIESILDNVGGLPVLINLFDSTDFIRDPSPDIIRSHTIVYPKKFVQIPDMNKLRYYIDNNLQFVISLNYRNVTTYYFTYFYRYYSGNNNEFYHCMIEALFTSSTNSYMVRYDCKLNLGTNTVSGLSRQGFNIDTQWDKTLKYDDTILPPWLSEQIE